MGNLGLWTIGRRRGGLWREPLLLKKSLAQGGFRGWRDPKAQAVWVKCLEPSPHSLSVCGAGWGGGEQELPKAKASGGLFH